jgi:hypothetical protein
MRDNFIGDRIFFEEYYDDTVYVGYVQVLEMRKPRNRPAKYRGIISIRKHETKIFQQYQKAWSVFEMINFLNAADPEAQKYSWAGSEGAQFHSLETRLQANPVSYWSWAFQRGVQNNFSHIGGRKQAQDRFLSDFNLHSAIKDAKEAYRSSNVRPVSIVEGRGVAGKHFPVKKVLKKLMLLKLSEDPND